MKLLFHCCCAPCSVASVESLIAEGIAPTLFWYNPNIHPITEYESRRDALSAFSGAQKLPLEMIDCMRRVHTPPLWGETEGMYPETNTLPKQPYPVRSAAGLVDEYGLDFFLRSVAHETKKPERCGICCRLRLEKTAAYAVERGFDAFSTSLLISPYQQHETIRCLGEELAAQYGIAFLYRDFRPLFKKGQTAARALGLYMQKYCGCVYSEKERYEQRSPLPSSLFQRLALITGPEALEKLRQTNVLIFGAGGVGSWCAEALVRSGIGKIGIVDYDLVDVSNVNRQVQATSRTIGRVKVEALKQRLLEINSACDVTIYAKTFSRETAAEFGIEKTDYAIDAIDTLPHKIDLIEFLFNAGVKFFSSMGMALRLDPTRIKTGSIWETRNCALARLVRQGLRERGFNGSFTVVYSDEQPINAGQNPASAGEKRINGSCVTVTAPAGMALASLVLRDIMEKQ